MSANKTKNSTKNNTVVVTDEIIETIDQNRGNLSRAEFVDLCVSSFLESRTWVCRREIPPAPTAETLIEQKPLPPPSKAKVPEKADVGMEVEEELPNHYFRALWVVAILTYGVGDLLTTYLALRAGLTELNPIMSFFGNYVSMFFFKVATLIAVFLVSWAFRHHKGFYYSVPIITAVVGVILTVNNLVRLA
jgi:hypothetical protein